MKTQDTNKDVCILEFSIFGVGGFKTVYAAGGKPEKRMLSAINAMDREFKDIEKRISAERAAIGHVNEEASALDAQWRDAKRALMLLSTIKDQVLLQQDKSFMVAGDSVQRISSEEFFTDSGSLYTENVAHFLANLSNIDTGIDKHILGRKKEGIANAKPTMKEIDPMLCVCTGGIFGDVPFYLFMTQLDIREMGKGDLHEAVKYFVQSGLITTKNFKLSDFLRLEGDKQEKVKKHIQFIDEHLDRLDEIHVVNAGSVLSPRVTETIRVNNALHNDVKKTSDMLMLEAEHRLQNYLVAILPKEPEEHYLVMPS